jgi:hypothetical protein
MKPHWRHFTDGLLAGFWWTVILIAVLGLVWLFVRDMLEVFS